jgi:hypothetical protein
LPINGAQVFTYEAGTLAPKAVYTTSVLDVAHANPIIASNGRASFYWGSGSYRVRVTDASGVELPAYAEDNISGASASSSSAGELSYTLETFTATAGQTLFTLAAAAVPGVDAIAVTVDGFDLDQGADWTISGTALTLTAPLSAGQRVRIRTGRLTTAGVSSDQVSFTQSGAASVSRSATSKMRDILSVQDKGASTGTGATQTSFIQAAVAEGVALLPRGNYRTDTALTGTYGLVALGDVTFSGTVPIDDGMPNFGNETLQVLAFGNKNAIVGTARNTTDAGTLTFPTGVTGYGRNDNDGNTVFGVYAEARQYADTGVVTNEIDSFNHGAAPTDTTTPNRSIGTTEQLPNALTIGAGGTAASWAAVHFTQEGSSPQSFLYGAIFDANAVTEAAIVIEAGATTGPDLPVLVKHKAAAVAMQLQTVGTAAPNNSVFQVVDPTAATVFSVRQNGRFGVASGITQTTVGSAGGASALPATPTGYMKFLVGSTEFVIPYYAAS